MSFPPGFLDELRARVVLSDIVGRRVAFDRRKSNPRRRDYWGCCPFHGEKTPSFHVDDGKGRYYCFGCGAKGDAITFLQETEGLSFPEAVESLARSAGLALPPRDPRAAEAQARRQSLNDVLETAQRYYTRMLGAREGQAARAYLEARQCGPALWTTFGLGYAPPGRTALIDHLRGEGVALDAMVAAGLAAGDGERAPHDRFRERIMFPIRDQRDRLVGFGGRTLSRESDVPKYLNSPETALFDKGRLLYNFGPARRALREAGSLLVVEGYMDVIALSGAGFTQAVAPLGTALTEDQLRLLWQATPEPVLCFDGDAAGRRAAFRAIDLALPELKAGQSLRFVLLPDGLDPDDVVRRQGAEAFRALLARPVPLVDLLFERERDAEPLDTPERRAGLERRLAEARRRIADPAVRHHYGDALTARLRQLFQPPPTAAGRDRRLPARLAPGPVTGELRRSALAQAARDAGPGAGQGAGQGAGPPGLLPPAVLTDTEGALLLLLVDHPELLGRLAESLAEIAFQTLALDRICNELIDLASLPRSLDSSSLQDHLNKRGVWNAIEGVAARDVVRRMRTSWASLGADAAERYWRRAHDRYRRARRLRHDLEEASAALQDAADEGRSLQRLRALTAEWRHLELESDEAADDPGVRVG